MAFRPGFSMTPIGIGYHQPSMIINPMIGRTFSAPAAQAVPKKPVTTVFVGNISEKCTNEFMEQLLKECGEISSWKRTQGTKGKVNAFGFCDFEAPEGTLRALRILNDFQIGERKLLVRADDKVRDELRVWAIEQRKRQGKPALQLKDNELPADEDDLRRDEEVRLKLLNWIEADHPDLLLAEDPGTPKEEKKPRKDADRKERRRRSRSRSDSRSRSRNGRRRSRSRSAKRRLRRRHSSSSSYSSDRSSGSSTSRSRSRTPKRKREHRRDSTDSDAEEKKLLKRQLKEKEQAYEARLKKWEAREREMSRRYERHDRAERQHVSNIRKEAKKLRAFLEEYDDFTDDAIFYKRAELFERRRAYEIEREADLKDRLREQAEINEIKQQLLKENMEEAVAEKMARKRHQEQEEAAMRRIRRNSGSPNPHTLLGQKEPGVVSSSESDSEVSDPADPGESGPGTSTVTVNTMDVARESGTPVPNAPTSSDRWRNVDSDTPASPPPQPQNIVGSSINFNSPTPAQKSLSQRIRGVFGFDEEEQEDNSKRIRFEVSQEERLQSLTEEEKKQMIKGIIDNIPTGKEDLFATPILWEHLSKAVVEQRVRPWVTKKINEFIGEEDKALCDFICESVENKVNPKKLLEDVAMIFDEDAEQFVMKMWRLIIYETESKKLGISKVKG